MQEERRIVTGRMKSETFHERQATLVTWFRTLEHRFPNDPKAQREHAEKEVGLISGTFNAYRRQSRRSDVKLTNGIPRSTNLEYIQADIDDAVKTLGLAKNGKLKATRRARPVQETFFGSPAATVTATPVQPRALVERADPSPLQIVRVLMAGMDKTSLKVVLDHAFELSHKS